MSFGVMAPTAVEQAPYLIPSGAAVGPWFDISRWRGGAMRLPVGATTTSFTFNVSNTIDSVNAYPLSQLRDLAGAVMSQTVAANKWIPLLPALFSYRFMQLVPNTTPGANVPLIISGVDGPVSWRCVPVTVAVNTAETSLIPIGGASAGSVQLGAWAGSTVTFEIGGGPGDVFAAVDAANANIAQTVAANRLLTIPREVFGAAFMRVVASGVQGSARVTDVWLKQAG